MAVFISYTSQDRAIAVRLCEALRAAGVEVWIDQEGLTGGDVWDRRIREQIRDCALFLPVLSAATEQRLEGYFRREWRLAADRSLDMSDTRPFLLPVVIDGTVEHAAQVPEAFLKVQWTRLPGGEITPAFLERIRGLLGRMPEVGHAAVSPPPTAALPSVRPPSRRWPFLRIALVMSVLLAAAYLYVAHFVTVRRVDGAGSATEKTIAVLPFTDMSEKKDQEYFSDGMAEEILDILVKLPQLKVIARTSSFQFKGRTDDVRHIGRELGARYVVEGSVRRAGDRVRITAQLVDSADGAHVWSQSYERPVTDVLDMQQDLATGIARALQLSLDPDEYGRHVRRPNPAAYEQYLRGRRDADQWTKEGWEKARGNLEAALDIDPTFASAWVALGMVYVGQADFGYGDDSKQLFHQARDAAHAALKLEPRAALAHAVLSDAASMADFDWPTAQREMALARQLEPGNALVLTLAGKLAMLQGDSQQAIALTARAVELDPLLAGLHQMAEYAYSCDRHYADAEAAIRQALRISPQYDGGHYELGMLLIAQGRVQEALPIVRLESNESSRELATAVVQDALGQHAEAEKLLLATQGLGDSDRAMFYGMRGDMDRAFTLLNRALDLAGAREDTNLAFIKCHVMWQPLHADARFANVLRRMKLPP